MHALLLPRPVADRQGGADRTLRIVLARDRRPEQRHHRVADELLHGATAALKLGLQQLLIGPEHRIDVLWVERLGASGEADQIGEQDRDDLSFSPWLDHGSSLGRLGEPL